VKQKYFFINREKMETDTRKLLQNLKSPTEQLISKYVKKTIEHATVKPPKPVENVSVKSVKSPKPVESMKSSQAIEHVSAKPTTSVEHVNNKRGRKLVYQSEEERKLVRRQQNRDYARRRKRKYDEFINGWDERQHIIVKCLNNVVTLSSEQCQMILDIINNDYNPNKYQRLLFKIKELVNVVPWAEEFDEIYHLAEDLINPEQDKK
jgi:hypothetical protein